VRCVLACPGAWVLGLFEWLLGCNSQEIIHNPRTRKQSEGAHWVLRGGWVSSVLAWCMIGVSWLWTLFKLTLDGCLARGNHPAYRSHPPTRTRSRPRMGRRIRTIDPS
jgi:hypothetical protein